MSARSRGSARNQRRRDRRRVAGAIGLLGASVAAAGKTAYGTFVATRTPTHGTSSALISVTKGDGDGAGGGNTNDQGFNLAVLNLYPGGSRERLVNITIGNTALDDVAATAPFGLWVDISAACGSCDSSLLDTAGGSNVDAIFVTIDRCSVAWTKAGGSAATPNETYTCGGAEGTSGYAVVSARPIIGTKNLTPDANGANTNATDVNYYRFTFALPISSPAGAHGLQSPDASTLEFKFGATQRDPTTK